jgi:hypothetical protein
MERLWSKRFVYAFAESKTKPLSKEKLMKPEQTCKRDENGRCNESPDGSGKVILIPDDRRVIIRDLECCSEEVYSYMETAGTQMDPENAIVRALECGATVLQRASLRGDHDYLEKLANESFGKLESTIREYIQKNLDPSEQGTLARRINDTFQSQHSQIKEIINKGDLHVSEFEKQMASFAQTIQATLQSALGKAMSDDQTGVSLLLREIKNEIQALRDKVVADATTAVTSSHVKGVSFEEEVFSVINLWAQNFQGQSANVIVEDVRSLVGPLGKQGDMVIRLLSGVENRICIEAKSQESISTAKILEVCKAAAENRHSDFTIYVASDEQNLPAEIGSWAQFDNRIITSMSGFKIALKMASCQLLLKKAKEQTGLIDIEKGLSLVQDIDDHMKRFGQLLASARATIKNAQKAQDVAIGIRDGIEEATEELANLLSINETGERKEAV